jgi:choline dehydrogenase-like flavoprotein
MGGATAGFQLAKAGRKVLFVEKGRFLQGDAPTAGADAAQASSADGADARLRSGLWPEPLEGATSFGRSVFFAPLGCGTGGSTLLYAAGLERFAPEDFEPRRHHPQATESTLPDRWPVTYRELEPYYEQAERLYRVRGTADPLRTGDSSSLLPPPPLSPRDRHLLESFQERGLHPYRIHVGCEFVSGCDMCTSGPCPRACKSDAARICLLPALEQFGASLLAECEVLRLDADRGGVTAAQCRVGDRRLAIRARTFVLAAGAYMTPVILLNSKSDAWPNGLANASGLVGRNLMFHVSDFIAVAPTRPLSGEGPLKSLALNDFYIDGGTKLGTFQTLGASIVPGQIMQYMRDVAERESTWWKKLASPRPTWWRKLSSPFVRLVALFMFHALNLKHASIWATIIEDLPYRDNRIVADPDARNGMRFEYRYADELARRVQISRDALARKLAPHKLIVLSKGNNLNFGHVCGTCRFGDDPAESVLDKTNRAHGVSNLYVVDASFFPSSGGTNPSLTIAANALRVADLIHASMGSLDERAHASP